MKRILFILAVLFAAAISSAQTPESAGEPYNLQKTNKALYQSYHFKIRNAIDSVVYHSGVDSLNCVVIDNLEIRADGTNIHSVKANGDNEEVNGKIEKAVAEISFPTLSVYDIEVEDYVPVDVTASFAIVCNVTTEWDEYELAMEFGYPQWKSQITDDHFQLLTWLSGIAFYPEDSGDFKIRFSTHKVNGVPLDYGTFDIYRLRRGKESLMVSYSTKALTGGSTPFMRSEEDMEKAKDENVKTSPSPSFMGGDANQFSVWTNSKLVYPKYCRANRIIGTVDVVFTVSPEGNLENLNVVKTAHPLLDREAFSIVSSSPKWEPGYIDGEPVSVWYKFPIIFKLRGL